MGVTQISKSKMTTKKKAIIIVGAILFCVVAAISAYALLKPDTGPQVKVSTVDLSDVVQTMDTTGAVESDNKGSFPIIEGVKVVSVNYRVGEKVSTGDVLATFDTASISSVLKEKQEAYNQAYAAYRNFISSSNEAKKELSNINAQIAELERKIDRLKKEGDSGSIEVASEEKSQLKTLLESILGDDYSDSRIGEMIDRLLDAGNSVSDLVNFLKTLSGGGSFDFSLLMGAQSEASSAEIELISLKAKQALMSVQSNSTFESLYKQISDSAYSSLQEVKGIVKSLDEGWVAQTDGIVREINIVEGQVYYPAQKSSSNLDITSILNSVTSGGDITSMIAQLFNNEESGMVVEYYPFIASIILGKYDVGKVKMDQNVIIKTVSGKEFNGYVTYISPVAESAGSINISSLLGSSGSTSGVAAKITIPNPDEDIIIGFDVDVSIKVDSVENVPVIPIEALQTDNEGFYVFVYDKSTQRVTRTDVTIGLYDGNVYQITSGCEVDDVIINNPPSSLMDGDRVSVSAK